MANKFEQLALWYLRLNGYLTVPNFILHPNTPGSQRTEADILAVRFPYSSEVAGGEKMESDSRLVCQDKKIDFIIAEVKSGKCDLNGPWTNPKRENMHYVLKWLGIVPESEVPKVAEDLYQDKVCERKGWVIRLVGFGNEKSDDLPSQVLQLTHGQVIKFMSERFKQFRDRKRDIEQWSPFIKKLSDMMMVTKCPNEILEWLSSQSDCQSNTG